MSHALLKVICEIEWMANNIKCLDSDVVLCLYDWFIGFILL